jgi:hypothetical protein
LDDQKRILEFDRTPRRASQKAARSVCNCLPDAFGLFNQYVVIELVDEEPTEEMILARDRFWEKVFVELLPSEEGSSVKAKRMNWTTRKS